MLVGGIIVNDWWIHHRQLFAIGETMNPTKRDLQRFLHILYEELIYDNIQR
jgi:hypothetical protein